MGLLFAFIVPCSPKHVWGCGGTSTTLQRKRLPRCRDYSTLRCHRRRERRNCCLTLRGRERRAASPGGSAGSGGSGFAGECQGCACLGVTKTGTLGLPGTRGPTAIPSKPRSGSECRALGRRGDSQGLCRLRGSGPCAADRPPLTASPRGGERGSGRALKGRTWRGLAGRRSGPARRRWHTAGGRPGRNGEAEARGRRRAALAAQDGGGPLRRPLCLQQPPHCREGRETGAARPRPPGRAGRQGGRGEGGPRPISCLHFLSSHRGSPGQRSPRSQPIRAALRAPPPRERRGRGE